jgi:hypothetical protein
VIQRQHRCAFEQNSWFEERNYFFAIKFFNDAIRFFIRGPCFINAAAMRSAAARSDSLDGICRFQQNELLRRIEPPRIGSKIRWRRIPVRVNWLRPMHDRGTIPFEHQKGSATNLISWTLFHQTAGKRIGQIADCSTAAR